MGKDEQSNQLNLTVVALVALVAIVGLVALVMNAASVKVATGSQLASASSSAADIAAAQNVVGGAVHSCDHLMDVMINGGNVASKAAARLIAWGECN